MCAGVWGGEEGVEAWDEGFVDVVDPEAGVGFLGGCWGVEAGAGVYVFELFVFGGS